MKNFIFSLILMFLSAAASATENWTVDTGTVDLGLPTRMLGVFPTKKIQGQEYQKFEVVIKFNDYFIKYGQHDHIGLALDGDITYKYRDSPMQGRGLAIGDIYGCFGVSFENFSNSQPYYPNGENEAPYCQPIPFNSVDEYYFVIIATKNLVYYQLHLRSFDGPKLAEGCACNFPSTVADTTVSLIWIGATTEVNPNHPAASLQLSKIRYGVYK